MTVQKEDRSKTGMHSSVGQLEQLIVFGVDGEEYAVPIGHVREVLELPIITAVPESLPFILGITNLRGQIVPILDLKKRLHLAANAEASGRHVLVVNCEDTLVGIQVDRVKEVLKVAKTDIQPAPTMITAKVAPEFVQGVVVISATEEPKVAARVVLVLDLQKIVTADEVQHLHTLSNKATQ